MFGFSFPITFSLSLPPGRLIVEKRLYGVSGVEPVGYELSSSILNLFELSRLSSILSSSNVYVSIIQYQFSLGMVAHNLFKNFLVRNLDLSYNVWVFFSISLMDIPLFFQSIYFFVCTDLLVTFVLSHL